MKLKGVGSVVTSTAYQSVLRSAALFADCVRSFLCLVGAGTSVTSSLPVKSSA